MEKYLSMKKASNLKQFATEEYAEDYPVAEEKYPSAEDFVLKKHQ